MNNIDHLRNELAHQSQRGITFIMAATIYWLGVGLAGIYLKPNGAFTISIWATGILFPISVLLAKVLRINIFFKNELTPLGIWANVFQLFFFPVFFASAGANINYPPVFMGVLAGAHFVFYAWLYNSRTYLILTFLLVASSYVMGYLFLDRSYMVVGLTNAGWLALGSLGLALENRRTAVKSASI
jgi:hypothetical protein